jgi:uroporphyrinogen decarboxylase
MTPKERAIAALTLKQPDEVPTFELGFHIEDEMFGKSPVNIAEYKREELEKLSDLEAEKKIRVWATHRADIYRKLEYSLWPMLYLPDMWNEDGSLSKYQKMMIYALKEEADGEYMLQSHGDGTFALPDGNAMYEFAYRLADDFDGILEEAETLCKKATENNKRLVEAGVDAFILCSDYCYNMGPFVSPETFSKIITPYLARIIESAKKDGAYVIKHTDGNIMPIIDQLVECNPHALHSLDPMAGVDIKLVKEKWGKKVALCGNVNCALMQTGTEQEVIESAEYCLTHGKPGGGYIFCTSNVPFK